MTLDEASKVKNTEIAKELVSHPRVPHLQQVLTHSSACPLSNFTAACLLRVGRILSCSSPLVLTHDRRHQVRHQQLLQEEPPREIDEPRIGPCREPGGHGGVREELRRWKGHAWAEALRNIPRGERHGLSCCDDLWQECVARMTDDDAVYLLLIHHGVRIRGVAGWPCFENG